MKVAINAAFLNPKGGGIKEYIKNLIHNIVACQQEDLELVVYVLEDLYDYALANLPVGLRIKKIPYNSRSLCSKIMRSLFEGRFWRREEDLEHFDVFHSPFFHSPRLRHAHVVVTVHDLRFLRFPSTYPKLRYWFLRYKVPRSLAAADYIITISDFTRSELCSLCHIPEEKITTIHEAINAADFRACDNQVTTEQDLQVVDELQGNRFLLTVGHLEPRKNYPRLIRAFAALAECDPDTYLVIVGKPNQDVKETLQLVKTTARVRYLNFVSPELLAWLYGNAQAFVFPSYYEGFGFPPLEAAVNGLVSAVSSVSSMPEVCGDSVAYFDPYDIDDMARALHAILDDAALRSQLASRLQSNLQRFSWARNASETIDVYRR